MAWDWDPKNLERIPAPLRDPMQLYVEEGVYPGSGLMAIICDERLSVVLDACDTATAGALKDIRRFLYNCVPGPAQGDRKRATAWMVNKGIKGQP